MRTERTVCTQYSGSIFKKFITSHPDKRQRSVTNFVTTHVVIRFDVIPILSTLYCLATPVIVSMIIRVPSTQSASCGMLKQSMKLVKATYQNVFIEAMDTHSENIKIINSIENQKHELHTIRVELKPYSFTQREERPRVSDHTLLVRMFYARICNRGEHTRDEQQD